MESIAFNQKLLDCARKNASWACVGLDPDPARMPEGFAANPEGVAAFNREIIQATSDLVCAYKPNLAFYEIMGAAGWRALSQTVRAIPSHIPVILDAKRGDIGNTAAMYARALFEELGGDAATVNPLLGSDSIMPFLEFTNKGIIILCLTSNPGAREIQIRNKLHLQVARLAKKWSKINKNVGLVVGATHPRQLCEIRKLCPNMMFLVPGVGAQGGELAKSIKAGASRRQLNMIINASRSIIHASRGKDFAETARRQTLLLRESIHAAASAE